MAELKAVHQFEFGNAWIDCDAQSISTLVHDGNTVRTLYAIPEDHLLIPRAILIALLDGDSNVSLVAAQELRVLLKQEGGAE